MKPRTQPVVPFAEVQTLRAGTAAELAAIFKRSALRGVTLPRYGLWRELVADMVANARWARLELQRSATDAQRLAALAVFEDARTQALATLFDAVPDRATMRRVLDLVDRELAAEPPGLGRRLLLLRAQARLGRGR